jgi:2-aminoadipate transaminase
MTGTQLISFARGAPSIDIVDVAGLKAAAVRALDTDPVAATGYGPATGYPPLRDWIADRHRVSADQVLITNGSLQADAFLFDHLVRPGDIVFVEKPSYDRTLRSLRELGASVHQVSMDADGIDVAELRKLLEMGVRPKLLHVIPNFQNPAGVTLSLARRQELLVLAREFGFVIFEDDPYAEIRFTDRDPRPPVPSLLELDEPGSPTVVHASSFTKTVCPGVRTGYLVGARHTIAAIAAHAVNLYICPNSLAEATVYQFCVAGDLQRSVQVVRRALAERASTLAAALRRQIPGCRFNEPSGGYFLWVDLPEDVQVGRLVPAAARRGVAVVAGTDFLLDGGEHSLRLAFSAVHTGEIDEGVRRLAAAIDDVRDR